MRSTDENCLVNFLVSRVFKKTNTNKHVYLENTHFISGAELDFLLINFYFFFKKG